MMKCVFTTHIYEFNGQLYKQKEGGPTGLRASGPLSRILMDEWAKRMDELERRSQDLHVINPVLYEPMSVYLKTKYVDDVASAMDKFRKGTIWSPTQRAMIWDPDWVEDLDQECATMREYTRAASSVFGCLNITWDSPRINPTNKMPVLDTMFWVGPPAHTQGTSWSRQAPCQGQLEVDLTT